MWRKQVAAISQFLSNMQHASRRSSAVSLEIDKWRIFTFIIEITQQEGWRELRKILS